MGTPSFSGPSNRSIAENIEDEDDEDIIDVDDTLTTEGAVGGHIRANYAGPSDNAMELPTKRSLRTWSGKINLSRRSYIQSKNGSPALAKGSTSRLSVTPMASPS